METSAIRHWPTREGYDAAMSQWQDTLFDPQLRAGQLARVRDSSGIARYGGAGLYVCVYRIDNYLVRCFRANPPKEPPADIAERYAATSTFITQHAARVPALIPIEYQAQGITVRDQVYPIVKMEFLTDAVPLGRYIARYYQDQTAMALLAEAWLRMIGSLEAASLAHGDLDLTNVLVQTRNGLPHLRLIDYDNLWIPALDGRRQTENGHEHFQHPAFLPPNERPFNAEMDRFSALVIYLALLALNQQPQLYDDWEADESSFLLLLRSDYRQIDPLSARLAHLRAMPGLAPIVDALVASLAEQRMPAPVTALARDFPIHLIAPHRPAPPPPAGRTPRPPVDLRPRVMAFPDAPTPAFRSPAAAHTAIPSQPAPNAAHSPGAAATPAASFGQGQAARSPATLMRKAKSPPEVPIHAGGPTPRTPMFVLSDMTPPPEARLYVTGTPALPLLLRRYALIGLVALILILTLALSLHR